MGCICTFCKGLYASSFNIFVVDRISVIVFSLPLFVDSQSSELSYLLHTIHLPYWPSFRRPFFNAGAFEYFSDVALVKSLLKLALTLCRLKNTYVSGQAESGPILYDYF